MKAPDRKRLWGKSANRCTRCKRPLTEPGGPSALETVLGEEAHIVGKNPGSARYRELPTDERDAYENRILLCPTDHAVVDGQPNVWTEEALLAMKRVHEESMAMRTADAQAHNDIHIDMPGAVETQMMLAGRELLELAGTALAYHLAVDEMPESQHHAAEDYLDTLKDYGEGFSVMTQLAERRAAASEIQHLLLESLRDHGIVFFGALIHCDVSLGRDRDRWPVAVLRARSAAQVAAEQQARAAM